MTTPTYKAHAGVRQCGILAYLRDALPLSVPVWEVMEMTFPTHRHTDGMTALHSLLRSGMLIVIGEPGATRAVLADSVTVTTWGLAVLAAVHGQGGSPPAR